MTICAGRAESWVDVRCNTGVGRGTRGRGWAEEGMVLVGECTVQR